MFRMHAIVPLAIGLTPLVAQAGSSSSDFVDPLFASMARSRVLTIDNGVVLARARGDELDGPGLGGGTSSTSSDRWRMIDSNDIDLFFNNDSLTHSRGGTIELTELGSASRMQGIANQSLQTAFVLRSSVEYSISVLITPTLAVFEGDADATLSFNFSLLGIDGWIRESETIDLTKDTTPREFVYSGTLDLSGSFDLLNITADSVLSTVIDAPGESARAGYTMSIVAEFTPVPSPSGFGVLAAGSLIACRRRRVSNSTQ